MAPNITSFTSTNREECEDSRKSGLSGDKDKPYKKKKSSLFSKKTEISLYILNE